MELCIGNVFAVRRTKRSTIWLFRLGAIAAFAGLLAAGLFFILNPVDPEDTIMGYIALGASVIISIVLWIISNKIQTEVAIHEEGVIVKKGKKEHRFHFSQIKGLIDSPNDSGTIFIHGGGGIVGAIAAGVVAGVAGAAADIHARNNVTRYINIVADTEDNLEVGVIKSAGDILSRVYTDWLIRNKPITNENIPSLTLSFGKELELSQGMFLYSRRRGDVELPLAEVTELEIREDSLMFFGLNEKGKTKCLIDINITKVYNIDLLFAVYNMAKE